MVTALDILGPNSILNRVGTPGINPAAPDHRPIQKKNNPLDDFLSKPGGMFLLNLLSQEGFSTMPQSPLAAVGRAGLATQEQGRQTEQSDLQRRLLESQIGLNTAKTQSEGQVGPDAESALGKSFLDLQKGLITQDVFDAQVSGVLGEGSKEKFAKTTKLRSEFNKETSGIRNSLQSLTAAQSLLANGGNPISELAAFISTIKSIDNSTVREGELNNFNKASGLVNNLENLISRAKGEGFSDTIAADIADTVNRLRTPLESVLEGSRKFYGREAGRFELEPSSIIGGAVSEPIDVGTVRSEPRDVTTGALPITATARQSGVTDEEWAVMSPEDRDLFKDE